ncbi:arsenic resistance protein [Desulfofalx alkaliphila]|uniref:arsenic resistance protein n=1 Tax=Desulfofalx alkaliphila TaxID=105483 RepID=UPI00068FADBB|nr:bile acid:sodium symporter [Desulfofalx alkaliphila]
MFFSITGFINRHVLQLLVCVILFSLAFGYYFPDVGHRLQPLAPFCLFFMLVPMMMGIKLEELVHTVKRIKLLSIVLIINFLLSPVLAGILAYYFLSHHPDFAVGLILLGTVPCAGMTVAWTAMARGNAPISVVVMAMSYLFGIFLIPFWVLILAGQYVTVSPYGMVKSVVLIIALPLAVGNLLRLYLTKRWGQAKFDRIKVTLPAISSFCMYLLFFIALSSGAHQLINHPEYIKAMLIPSLIFYPTLFLAAAAVCRLGGLDYPDLAAVSYSVTGKNIAVTLALATVFFNPQTVLVTAIMPVIQVSYMAAFYRLSPTIRKKWGLKKFPKNTESSP